MTSKRFNVVVFDAYGTLFDVHGAMARYAAQLGQHWTSLATEWRNKQLEYTWIGSLTGHEGHQRRQPKRRHRVAFRAVPATPGHMCTPRELVRFLIFQVTAQVVAYPG